MSTCIRAQTISIRPDRLSWKSRIRSTNLFVKVDQGTMRARSLMSMVNS